MNSIIEQQVAKAKSTQKVTLDAIQFVVSVVTVANLCLDPLYLCSMTSVCIVFLHNHIVRLSVLHLSLYRVL